MRIFFVILFHLFVIQSIFSQCDCEKIHRDDGTVTQCTPLPIGGDNNLQFGLSLFAKGEANFVTLTIRLISEQSLKIIGDLNLRLTDNNLLTFKLVNRLSSYVGNSEVESGIFTINETQFNKLKNASLLVVLVTLSDNRMHPIEATINQDVLMNQAKCLRNQSQSGWIEMKGEIGNFYITFPNTPEYTPGRGWFAKDKDDQVTYLISFMESPDNQQMSIATVEKYLLPSMMKGNIEVSKSYLTYNGYEAIDFLYKTTGSPVLYKKGCAIIRGQKLYVLQVLYYFSNLAEYDKFSKSLRFY
jgi:hypothetical protein